MRPDRYIALLLLALIAACEEPTSLEFESAPSDRIAVEAVLTNENIQHVIRITRPYQAINGIPAPVSGAVVEVIESGTAVRATENPLGSGRYLTPAFRALTGVHYALRIVYQQKEFYATDIASPVEPLQPISVSAVEGQFKVNYQESGREANYVDHQFDWSQTPVCPSNACTGRVVFYDLKNIDVNKLYKPAKDDLLVPANTMIVRKKYSVSPAYRAFLRSMLSETEWRGGVFDVTRDNTPTNFSNGALGFFAVSTVLTDTTFVK